jgi:3-oxoacyl-[acyl-carrier protein] reductase
LITDLDYGAKYPILDRAPSAPQKGTRENRIMTPLDFSGQTVLVVGGSSGIGNGIAQAFREHGATVHVWGTRPGAEDYAREAGSDLAGLSYSGVDVGDADAVERWDPPFDKLDVLVQCQGTVVYKRGEFEKPGWDKVMSVNLDSLMLIATKFRTSLTGGGRMIIVSSISGFQANIGNPAYSASKAGAISLTKVLGKAWAREGIRVNGIAPGLVATKLTSVTTQDPQRMAGALAAIPDGREGTPDDMGHAALFLASPLAGYVTGHTLVVDGGLSL